MRCFTFEAIALEGEKKKNLYGEKLSPDLEIESLLP